MNKSNNKEMKSTEERIKFMELGEKEREILLSALEIDKDNLVCRYCKEKTNYKKCSILPPIKKYKNATITCSSPFCTAEYLTDSEEEREPKMIPLETHQEKIEELKRKLDWSREEICNLQDKIKEIKKVLKTYKCGKHKKLFKIIDEVFEDG